MVTTTVHEDGMRNRIATLSSEDVLSVRSRISWGAIVAGSVFALAFYFLLTLLGGAIGLSVSDKTSAQGLTGAAAAWVISTTVICLFVGGFVASQFTVGESKREAIMYGMLVWAVVFTMLLWLMATGVRAGFNAMVGVATASTAVVTTAAQTTTQEDWEAVSRRAGFDQKQIDEVKQRVKDAPVQAKQAIEDPAMKQKAEATARDAGEAATKVTWYAFFGTLLSMLAAAGGSYLGAGSAYRLFAVRTGTVVART